MRVHKREFARKMTGYNGERVIQLPVIACPMLVDTVVHVASGDKDASVVFNASVSGCSAVGSCRHGVSCLFKRCLRLCA